MMQYDYEFRSRRSNVMSSKGMAASSQPLATLAGVDILRKGGNAADAAIGMAATLNVVEPFSTGVGGDCFALYWDNSKKQVFALNGSGPAAKSASIDDLKAQGYEQFPQYSGHAVSVPGAVAGWAALNERFGSLPLGELLKPAIGYAFDGYPVTEWIGSSWEVASKVLLRNREELDTPVHLRRNGPSQPSGHEYLIDGRTPKVGEVMTLPTLGATLKMIAEGGKDAFLRG